MNKEQFWEAVLQEMLAQKLVKELILKSWIRPLKVLHVANGILLIKVADDFAYSYVNDRFSAPILEAAAVIDPTLTEVRFTVEESVPVPRPIATAPAEPQASVPQKKNAVPTEERAPFQHPLNKKYQFDTFISGYDNSFAFKSALSVAESPEKNRFSPLVIYGGVGLGKSHLLHAIGNLVKKQRPRTSVVLTTAEEFFYNYSASLGKKNKDKGKEFQQFTDLFMNCGVLLIDEIQHLSGKEQCQIELFRIFNQLHQQGALIVFTADRPPEKLLGFEERLISRIQWGLAVEIQEPQAETRLAIITEFAQREHLDLSPEVLAFIAEHGPANVREMEGIIIKLLVQASVLKADITLATAEASLNQRLLTDEQKFAIDRIVSFCCNAYGVSEKQLKGKGRSKEVALCRQVGMYIAKNHTTFTLKAIGLEFGGRDHSTVVHAVNSIDKRIHSESDLAKEVEQIIADLSR